MTRKKSSKKQRKAPVPTSTTTSPSSPQNDNNHHHDDTTTTTDNNNTPISFGNPFSSLSPSIISPQILSHITSSLHHTHMTPIQQSAIPLLLSNKDIVAEAVTGSGKTLAYLVPMVQMISDCENERLQRVLKARREGDDSTSHDTSPEISRKIRGVIICPTRELTKQVYQIAKSFESAVPELSCLLVSGGVQRQYNFNEYSLIVATPGRLLELMLKKQIIGLDLSQVEMLVLDEADKILEMGFDTQVNAILKELPSQRRTALFSATQTKDMYKWIKAGLRNPVRVSVKVKRHEDQKSQATPLQLQNFYMLSGYDDRLNQLINFLKQYASNQKIIIYFYTCACVEYFYLALKRLMEMHGGRNAKDNEAALALPKLFMLHGQIKNKKRRQILERFRAANQGILISTDVTARGIDMPNISVVVQFDPPRDPASFVHRVGRSARMGNAGSSLLFLTEEEDAFSDYLKRKKIPLKEIEPYEHVHNYVADLKTLTLRDRELFEKSEEALKSFARGYKEHQLTYIFDKKKLNYDELCVGFSMLRKPPIDQLKTHKFRKFKWNADLNLDAIPYMNPEKEKARKKKKQREKEAAKKKQDQKEKKAKEKDAKNQTATAAAAENDDLLMMDDDSLLEALSDSEEAAIADELATVGEFKQRRTELRSDRSIRTRKKKRIYQEMVRDEVNYENLLLKKVKKGKISEKEYERLTGETYFMDKIDGFKVNMNDVPEGVTGGGKKSKKKDSKKNAGSKKKRKRSAKKRGGMAPEEIAMRKKIKLDWA